MKKLNKKGFTLAELLIVIAIIAILIAIAIPVFAGQLDNARIQTDHANMRSAYAMAQVANLEGVIYTGTDGATPTTPTATGDTFYFQADGSVTQGTGSHNYELKATVANGDAKCASSAVCTSGQSHTAGHKIVIVYTPASTGAGAATPAKWTVELRAS